MNAFDIEGVKDAKGIQRWNVTQKVFLTGEIRIVDTFVLLSDAILLMNRLNHPPRYDEFEDDYRRKPWEDNNDEEERDDDEE